MKTIELDNLNAQTVVPAKDQNPRVLYEHQIEAMKKLDMINKKETFKTLLVLPTGGGKTLTAAYWLLKNAVDKGYKVLWIAHRHLLLEQAAEAFSLNAYTKNMMINSTTFNYRIISGKHDKPIHIKNNDNVLFASKDSITHGIEYLKDWLDGENVYLVIDEAHHAVARSYRKIIDYVFDNSKSTKLLGLTATPFRTSDEEAGALKQIFDDDIVYKTDLETLIKKEILAKPICREFNTEINLGSDIGLKAMKSIENLDILPEDIATEIAQSSNRNNFIVKKYFEDYEKYGPTLVFAVNLNHAVTLNALFNSYGKKYGIKSDFIISSVRDMITGVSISNEDNNRKIEMYRKGDIQVLINVNILTEGTDLPKTHTVFLTRPTVSTVLMTQMIGRALRGVRAGGTKEAYIVSFIDNWNDKIAWVNPETLTTEGYEANDNDVEYKKKNIRLIALSKIEEFALMADETVDTSLMDSIPAIERIPLGMYTFTFLDNEDGNSMERHHQILVYNSTKPAYDELIRTLPDIFEQHKITKENIPEETLNKLLDTIKIGYFNTNMIPSYNQKDIEYLLKFFAEKKCNPLFITFDEIDRQRLDISKYAEHIYNNDLGPRAQKEYLETIWNNSDIIPIYYTHLYFFRSMIEKELNKLLGYSQSKQLTPTTTAEKRNLEKYPLQKIIDLYPNYGQQIKNEVFEKSKDADGYYVCAKCGYKSKTRQNMQIDHIKPMAKGGLTQLDNLQVLCSKCNKIKGDK